MRRRQSFGLKGQLEMAAHVFADSLRLALGLSPDLAVDVETCVALVEDLLDQGKADEFFPQKQGENLRGEDFLDHLVMVARDKEE